MSVNSNRPVRFETWRINTIYIVILLAFTALLLRLINLQIFQNADFATRAIDNYTNEVSVPAPRGIIYDRYGYILARNVASYNIVITPANLPLDDSEIQQIYRELSEIIDVPFGSFISENTVTDELLIDVPGGFLTESTLEEAKLFSACIPGPSIAQMLSLIHI